MEEDNADEDEGWGHWAMPGQQNLVDVELQAGEFLELNDLMGPLDVQVVQPNDEENSGITLFLGLPGAFASTAESIDGGHTLHNFEDLLAPLHVPEMQVVAGFDLNIPPLPEQEIAAVEPVAPNVEDMLQMPVLQEHNLAGVIPPSAEVMLQLIEPVLQESNVAAIAPSVPTSLSVNVDVSVNDEVPQAVGPSSLPNQPVVIEQDIALGKLSEPTYVDAPILPEQVTAPLDSTSKGTSLGAPPAFPFPVFNHNSFIGAVQLLDQADPKLLEMLAGSGGRREGETISPWKAWICGRNTLPQPLKIPRLLRYL